MVSCQAEMSLLYILVEGAVRPHKRTFASPGIPTDAEPEQDRHDAQQDPSLPLGPHHATKAIRQRGAERAKINIASKRFVSAVGFSNGCAELALKKPPPSPLNSLIASWVATGPRAITWVLPSSVPAIAAGASLCGTPSETRNMAAKMQMGSRT
jgi:hypothetical protein